MPQNSTDGLKPGLNTNGWIQLPRKFRPGSLLPVTITWTVQYELPVDNPVDKVRVDTRKAGRYLTTVFYVPLNHPLAHQMGLEQLLHAVERQDLFTLSTDHNKTGLQILKESINKECGRSNSTGPQPQRPTPSRS